MESLLQLIKTRQSTRTPFDPERPVAREHLQQILEAGAWAPTAHNMQNYEVVVIDDKTLLEQIRHIEYPTSPTFIQENYLQLSLSEEELRQKKVGVLSTLFPRSWMRPGLMPEHPNARDIGNLQSQRGYEISDPEEIDRPQQSHNQLLPCAALMLLVYDSKRRAPASEGDVLGIMSLGCVLENMWLMAASLGISFHVVSALSGDQVQPTIKELLSIPEPLTIAISFRLGYPLAAANYLRVRRDVNSFTHYNGFNKKASVATPHF